MEFAVVTALMAVLAATAAPKFSDISESGKFRKSKSEMEKIAKQALNFYQDNFKQNFSVVVLACLQKNVKTIRKKKLL